MCSLRAIVLSALLAAAAAAAAAEQEVVWYLFKPACFETLFTKLDVLGFLTPECVKFSISKGLGYAIILGSLVLKAPQIYNVVSSGSVAGLSTASFYSDVVTFSVGPVYSFLQGYPLSTYGEEIVILAQNLALVGLMWKYRSFSVLHKLVALGAYSSAMWYALQQDPGCTLIQALPKVTIFTVIVARAPQVWVNFGQGHTGQLSLVTTLLNMAGSLARVFTTLQELNDFGRLMGYIVSLSLNLALVVQMLMYRAATKEATAAAAKKDGKKNQ